MQHQNTNDNKKEKLHMETPTLQHSNWRGFSTVADITFKGQSRTLKVTWMYRDL